MAYKTVVETFGQLTYFRVYQGTIIKGESYTNQRTGKKDAVRPAGPHACRPARRRGRAEAGDIVAVVGVDCASGDTFCGTGVNVALERFCSRARAAALHRADEARRGRPPLQGARAIPPRGSDLPRDDRPRIGPDADRRHGPAAPGSLRQRIRREYKCECLIGEPKVAYRECPTKQVEYNFRHKKQTGGSGQYAHIVGHIEPFPEDAPSTYEFVNEVIQGRIPKEYIKPVDEGFKRALDKGPLCECPVVGVRAVLAGRQLPRRRLVRNGLQHLRLQLHAGDADKKAKMALQEPIMKLEVEVPEEFQGPVTGQLSSKRGIITQTEVRSGTSVISAEIPLATMFDYANELRSMTQGKGSFSMEFSRYRRSRQPARRSRRPPPRGEGRTPGDGALIASRELCKDRRRASLGLPFSSRSTTK